MTKVTCDMAMSVDGFTAGPNQTLDKRAGMFRARQNRARQLAAASSGRRSAAGIGRP
jgi:hypothetical protein